MNFDELKAAWQQENVDEIELPHEVKQLKSALSPIEKIKKNMKLELYLQVLSVIILGFYPAFYNLNTYLSIIYFIIFTLLIFISIYYIWKFKQFFNYISKVHLNSKDSLYEIYYEIRVNIETYKSWCFASIQLGSILTLLLVIGIFKIDQRPDVLIKITQGISAETLIIVTSLVIFNITTLTTMYFWIKAFYGKYLKQIKELIQELKETETT